MNVSVGGGDGGGEPGVGDSGLGVEGVSALVTGLAGVTDGTLGVALQMAASAIANSSERPKRLIVQRLWIVCPTM